MLKTVFAIGLIVLGFALLLVMRLLEKRVLNRARSLASHLAAGFVAVSILRFAQMAQQAALQDSAPPG